MSRYYKQKMEVSVERKLATMEKVLKVTPIGNSDFLEKITVRGWDLVSKKGEFKPGDKCIFFEIDSLIPKGKECFEFLRKTSWVERLKGFRIRTIRLRGVVSQGLALPLEHFPEFKNMPEGTDLTKTLGVTVYEPYVNLSMNSNAKGAFPTFLKGTSLERIQNALDAFESHKEKQIIITEKLDGTSHTFYSFQDKIGMASRSLDLKIEKDRDDVRNRLFRDYNMKKILTHHPGIAIQGEIVGKSIQRKQYQLDPGRDYDFYVYRIYHIPTRTFYTTEKSKRIAESLGLKFVPVLGTREMFKNIEEAITFSCSKSKLCNSYMEGIVFTVLKEEELTQYKVISPKYLLAEGKI